MRIVRGRPEGAPSVQKQETFVGTVWADPVLPTTDGNTINTVMFTPGARTNWHEHEHGQILEVTAGQGWICTHGQTPQVLRAGDTVWVPAGERHWHGATDTTWMSHRAISLGATHWLHEVSEQEYAAAGTDAGDDTDRTDEQGQA